MKFEIFGPKQIYKLAKRTEAFIAFTGCKDQALIHKISEEATNLFIKNKKAKCKLSYSNQKVEFFVDNMHYFTYDIPDGKQDVVIDFNGKKTS